VVTAPAAEASGGADSMAGAVEPLHALEVPMTDSGPSDGLRPPTTLPGMGAAAGEARRVASELPVQAEGLDASSPSASDEGSSPAALPLLNAPRTASGEIVVRKTAPMKMKPSADAPLPKPARTTALGRSESDGDFKKPYVRPSQSTTPPGSARALDELPPFADAASVMVAANRAEAAGSGDVADQIFSRADADDELGLASRRRGLWLVAAAAVVLIGGIAAMVRGPSKKPHGARTMAEGSGSGVQAPAVPAPTVEPLPPTHPIATTPTTTTGAEKGVAGKQVSAVTAAEAVDERADPKLARARAAEASTLLGGCRAAFSEGRMKDAEAACVAAKDANPESAEAHGLLAHALFNRNHRREALGAAERAVKLNPKWADAYVIIGGVRQDAGDTTEAKRAYQRYLDLDPHGQYAPDLRAIVGKLEPAKL
jgi:tetratricopeptide (TPR) repeat protein